MLDKIIVFCTIKYRLIEGFCKIINSISSFRRNFVDSKDWLEYFEAINGRKPSSQEFLEAKESGLIGAPSFMKKTEEVTEQKITTVMKEEYLENFPQRFKKNDASKSSLDTTYKNEMGTLNERLISRQMSTNGTNFYDRLLNVQAFKDKIDVSADPNNGIFHQILPFLNGKHKVLLTLIVVGYLAFLFCGFRPLGKISYASNLYEVGSIFIPKKYTTGYGGYSFFNADKEIDRQMNGSLARFRYRFITPMIISVAVMGVSTYLLRNDQEFQTYIFNYYRQKKVK